MKWQNGYPGNDTIRFIPHKTVDNNLGPDRLAGPKALLCLEVIDVY